MRTTLAVVFFAGAMLTTLLPIQAQAEGGCGIGWHREVAGVAGPCVRNREVIVTPGIVVEPAPSVVVVEPRRRVCPPGFHLGPEGRECHRN